MSKANFDREYVKPLLRRLKKEKRKSVEAQKGQVIILENVNEFEDVIKATFPGRRISKAASKRVLAAGRKKAASLQSSFKSRNKARFNKIEKKLETIPAFSKYTIGSDIFVVTGFSSANIIKNTILSSFETEGVLSSEDKKDVRGKIHRGHGVEGAAVSQVEIASAITSLPQSDRKLFVANLDSYLKTNSSNIEANAIIEGISGSYDQVVTAKGDLRADYFSVINYQAGTENLVDAVDEKAAKKVFRQFVEQNLTKKMINVKGSSTLKEKAETVIVDAAFGKASKLPNIKVTRSSKAKLKTGGKTKTQKKEKASKNSKVKRVGTFRGAAKTASSKDN